MSSAKRFKALLSGACALGVLALAATEASAGGFSSRQQSSAGLGFAYAGAGTSVFGLGSMFWNPANITNFQGRRSEWNFTLVLPESSVSADRLAGAGALAGVPSFFGAPTGIPRIGSGNINQGTLTTASYSSYQVNDWLWLGLQSGVPFGSRTKPEAGFAGAVYGTSTIVRGTAITPTIGIKLNDWISFGFGITGQQLNVSLSGNDPRFAVAALGAAGAQLGSPNRIKGDAYGIGWTAGVTIKPFQGTEISLGYRSSIHHSLRGEFDFAGPLAANPAVASRLVRVNVNLPEIATLGISQQINDQWTVTGTAQWTNWSRIGTAPVVNRVNGAPITGLGFRYRDEYFFALGAQYQLNEAWKLRAGVAYEISPITDETRGVRVLDSNRLWVSLGAGYKWNEKLEFDLSYSHIFLEKGRVDIVGVGSPFNPAGNPASTATGNLVQFNGTSKGHLDLISFGIKYRWDDPSPSAAPIVKKY